MGTIGGAGTCGRAATVWWTKVVGDVTSCFNKETLFDRFYISVMETLTRAHHLGEGGSYSFFGGARDSVAGDGPSGGAPAHREGVVLDVGHVQIGGRRDAWRRTDGAG